VIVERPALERRVLESLDAGRIPVVLGGCAAGRTSLLLRLQSFFGRERAQYIDFAAAATTPERCIAAVIGSAPPAVRATATPAAPTNAKAAFDGLTHYFSAATTNDKGPVTFLIDEVQDVRTFESFPGLRHVQRDLITRMGDSPNGFVLASRFTTRAHRLLRDAPARFEVIHMPPMGADEVHLLVRHLGNGHAGHGESRWSAPLAEAVATLAGGRAGYARLIVDAVLAQPSHGHDAQAALAAALRSNGALTARCRESYEFRLHRARGYGALKAILGVLAEQEGLTLTEISQRLHRTPGSTKDYLSWLEDVDLVTVHRKRYTFTDPLLRLFIRLHAQPVPPTDEDITREVDTFARSTAAVPPLAAQEAPVAAPTPAAPAAANSRVAAAIGDRSGIIEID
jgi:hypothetical protein